MQKFLYVLPRALAILMVGFTAIFILEGFSPEFSIGDALSHAVLTFVIAVATAVAWKWPKYGGWIFFLIAFPFMTPLLRGDFEGASMIGLVPLLTGILFIREGFAKKSAVAPTIPRV